MSRENPRSDSESVRERVVRRSAARVEEGGERVKVGWGARVREM